MSEMEKREEISRFDSMSTEELQEILRKHAHGELDTEPDTDELFEIMEVLSVRREQSDPHAFKSNEEAYQEFCNHYMPKDEKENTKLKVVHFPGRVFKTAAASLAIVFFLVAGTTITAKALNYDIWGKFANWTKEIFHFADEKNPSNATAPEKDHNLELLSLHDALKQYNITQSFVPNWLPDGYNFVDLNVIETPREISISAKYEKGNTELIIRIRQIISGQADQIEKNDDLLEVYTVDGVEYYIFSNTETMQAAWSIGEFECMIVGKITVKEIKAMIDSI